MFMKSITGISKKLLTLTELVAEYRNQYFLAKSLIEYLILRRIRLSKKPLVRLTLPNGRICLTFNDNSFIRATIVTFDEIYIRRIYEKLPEFKATQSDTILDAGAFIGLYTLKNAHAHMIYAVEPHPLSYILLRTNTRINELDNVKILNYALSDCEAKADLYVENFLISGSTLVPEWHNKYHEAKVRVKTITLDALHQLGVLPSYIDIAKVDIEGSELLMLYGSRNYLEKGGIDRVVLEIHHTVVDPLKFIEILRGFNFKILKIIDGNEVSIVYAKLVR